MTSLHQGAIEFMQAQANQSEQQQILFLMLMV